MITVAQLIEKLSHCGQGHIVLLASDQEGNYFRGFSGDINAVLHDGGEVYFHDDFEVGDETNAIVLWP